MESPLLRSALADHPHDTIGHFQLVEIDEQSYTKETKETKSLVCALAPPSSDFLLVRAIPGGYGAGVKTQIAILVSSKLPFHLLATAALAAGLVTESQAAAGSAEKTAFAEVTAQLDAGGNLYGYLSTSQWMDGLSGRIESWRDVFTEMPGMAADDKVKVTQAFDLGSRIIKASGIEGISGIGISGIAIEEGLYQTKFVVQRDPAKPNVGIWKLFGESPRPLDQLSWLPRDTAWATFADLDAAALWKGIVQEVNQSGFAEAKQALAKLQRAVRQGTDLTPEQLLNSLGGQFGVFLTLNETRMVNLPSPGNAPLQFPEPGLVIVMKVKDDTLFKLIDSALRRNPQTISSEENGIRMRTIPVPLLVPMNLRPTVAREGDQLWFGSNDELLKSVLALKAGQAKQPGIKSTDEFKRLSQGMALDGNSCVFVSDRLGKALQQILAVALGQAAQGPGAPPAALMQKITGFNGPVSSFAIGSRTPQGWLTVTRGTQHPAQAVILPFVVAPTAIMAGLALPALTQAKGKAQSIQCVNNLKQIGLAARIYAVDHNDEYPPDLASMKVEMTTPRILICPKNPDQANAVSWDTFDISRSSYEYFPGRSETSPQEVLARCRFHGHECRADGSVRQKPLR